jgi:hypothetical protein
MTRIQTFSPIPACPSFLIPNVGRAATKVSMGRSPNKNRAPLCAPPITNRGHTIDHQDRIAKNRSWLRLDRDPILLYGLWILVVQEVPSRRQ